MKPFEFISLLFGAWSFVDLYIYSDGPFDVTNRTFEWTRRYPQVHKMLSCPKCLGLWTGLALLALRLVSRRAYWAALGALSASGAATLIDMKARP